MNESNYKDACNVAVKVKRIDEAINLKDYLVVYAYGDRKEGHPILGIAHKRYYQWSEV